MTNVNPGPASSITQNLTAFLGTPPVQPATPSMATLLAQSGIFQNFQRSNFPNLRSALANMSAGLSDPLIYLVGDSTMGGFNGTNYVGTKTTSPPRYMGTALTALGIPASEEIAGVTLAGGQGFTWDSRMSQTNWTNVGGSPGIFGIFFDSTTNGGILSFTPTRAFDSFDIYTAQNTAGTITVNVDGGPTLATITSPNASAIAKTTVNCAWGTHTINLVQVGTTGVFVNGIVPHTSTARQINIANLACPGGLASSFSSTANFYAPGQAASWTLPAPCLAIIEMTVNDSNAPTALAPYMTAIQAVITVAKAANCDIIISTGNPINTANGIANISAMISALRSLAVANGCGFIDMNFQRYGSYAIWNAIQPYADSLHPNNTTAQDKGTLYAAAVQTAASL